MALRVNCPVCSYRIKAPDGAYGRRGQCPRCRLMIRLPSEVELAAQQASRAAAEAGDSNAGGVRQESQASADLEEVRLDGDSSAEFRLGSPGE